MDFTKGDKIINLPTLQFPTQDGLLKPKPEGAEKTDVKTVKAEGDKKKCNEEEIKNNTPPTLTELTETTSRTFFTIVPGAPLSASSTGETSAIEMVVDVAPR